MGEAKRRGNFESRQAEGILKNIKAAEEHRIKLAEYEASLTPAQRAKREEAKIVLTTMAGLATSIKIRG